jgi:hypothetical protein
LTSKLNPKKELKNIMAKITILRALNEVSTLNKKIEKSLQRNGSFLSYSIGEKPPTGFKTLEDVSADIKSRFDSINALITRRSNLKSAIVASNAVTMVIINGVEMTVAAAIEFKTSVQYRKSLLSTLVNNSSSINRKVEQHNERIEQQAVQLAEQVLGSKAAKVAKDDVAAITEPFKKDRIAALIDPLGISKVIDSSEDEINGFENEVDNILTESNATTEIEVPEK